MGIGLLYIDAIPQKCMVNIECILSVTRRVVHLFFPFFWSLLVVLATYIIGTQVHNILYIYGISFGWSFFSTFRPRCSAPAENIARDITHKKYVDDACIYPFSFCTTRLSI